MNTTSFGRFAAQYDASVNDRSEPAIFQLMGNLEDKNIYDLCCGNGHVARACRRQGAADVWASDISPELIELAKTKYDSLGVTYVVRNASDFDGIPSQHFHLIVMNMVVMYVADIDGLLNGVRQSLRSGGNLVLSLPHPFASDRKRYGEEHESLEANPWTGSKDLTMLQRPVSFYINQLGRHGLSVNGMLEPEDNTVILRATKR